MDTKEEESTISNGEQYVYVYSIHRTEHTPSVLTQSPPRTFIPTPEPAYPAPNGVTFPPQATRYKTAGPITGLNMGAAPVDCPSCGQRTLTNITHKIGTRTQ